MKRLKLKKMTYGEKLVLSTCLYCGCPLQLDTDRCNYCGSSYVSLEEIIKKDTLDFTDNHLILNVNMHQDFQHYSYIVYHGMLINRLSHFNSNKEISFSYTGNFPIVDEFLKDFGSYKKRDIVLDLKNHKVLCKGAFINSVSTNYTDAIFIKDVTMVVDKFIFDKFAIRE